jgi:hypothetical protein
MRYALIGATMPAEQLMGATSVSRTTQDSARIMGALAGAGLVAALGMGPTYAVIACFYATSFVLTLNVSGARSTRRAPGETAGAAKPTSSWRDLRDGIARVWSAPQMFAALCLAFLVNLTAFPLVMGLMPYVAKEIYRTDQTGLGYLVASWAFGALVGYYFEPRRTRRPAGAHHDRRLRSLVRHDPGVRPDAKRCQRQRGAHARRLRAKPGHGLDVGDAVAHRRR